MRKIPKILHFYYKSTTFFGKCKTKTVFTYFVSKESNGKSLNITEKTMSKCLAPRYRFEMFLKHNKVNVYNTR